MTGTIVAGPFTSASARVRFPAFGFLAHWRCGWWGWEQARHGVFFCGVYAVAAPGSLNRRANSEAVENRIWSGDEAETRGGL